MIQEVYNRIKNHCLAVYYSGSLAVPFLENYVHDYDFEVACKNDEDIVKCRRLIAGFSEEDIENDEADYVEENDLKVYLFKIDTKPAFYCWINHFACEKTHYGNVSSHNYNILEHKKEVVDSLISFYNGTKNKKDKRYYHILASLYILDNNSYNFTQEQITQIQLAHNKNISNEAISYIDEKIHWYLNNYDLIGLSAAELEIVELKKHLADTDYQAIKFAEGEMSAEDYAPYKAQRQQWRARINELEAEL